MPYGISPVVLSLSGITNYIEPILLAEILFDLGIRKQQAVQKHCHTARLEMRRWALPDLEELDRTDVMIHDDASITCDLSAIAHRVDFPAHP